MLKRTPESEKKVLIALGAALVLLVVYRSLTVEQPKTVPLANPPGTVAQSAVRQGTRGPAGASDPLDLFLARREERFPGVNRDIFRMENPEPRPKPKLIAPPPVTAPVMTVPAKTPEQIAEEQARADLAKFKFLGYLTDKENTLFLSKDGELFIVKTGDRLLTSYQVKEASKEYVVLQDTVTKAEARIDLSGGDEKASASPQHKQAPAAQPQRMAPSTPAPAAGTMQPRPMQRRPQPGPQ